MLVLLTISRFDLTTQKMWNLSQGNPTTPSKYSQLMDFPEIKLRALENILHLQKLILNQIIKINVLHLITINWYYFVLNLSLNNLIISFCYNCIVGCQSQKRCLKCSHKHDTFLRGYFAVNPTLTRVSVPVHLDS